jgi:hypothetical protein
VFAADLSRLDVRQAHARLLRKDRISPDLATASAVHVQAVVETRFSRRRLRSEGAGTAQALPRPPPAFYAPGRIRTSDPRIRSPPICLRKRRFSPLVKPNSVNCSRNLLPSNFVHCVGLIDTGATQSQTTVRARVKKALLCDKARTWHDSSESAAAEGESDGTNESTRTSAVISGRLGSLAESTSRNG